jgi:uncharacterized protein YbaP (TraB family)
LRYSLRSTYYPSYIAGRKGKGLIFMTRIISFSRQSGAWLLLAVALLLSTLPAYAGDRFGQGLLWEITPASGEPSYLFGTIHSEDPRVIELPPPVRDAFEASNGFAMEVIPDTQAILQSMVTMVYTDGRTLEAVIGPPLFRQVVQAIEARGMTEAAIRDFKPWAVVTILSVPPAETGEFLDMRLYKAASAAGKRVVGLESIDEQLAVFEELSERDQVALLRETLEVRDQLPEVFERLLGAYQERDLAELVRLSEEYLRGGDPELEARFRSSALDVRNERMAERILPLLAEDVFFVAVGALHLPGEGGIVQRLRRAGFAVRSVY